MTVITSHGAYSTYGSLTLLKALVSSGYRNYSSDTKSSFTLSDYNGIMQATFKGAFKYGLSNYVTGTINQISLNINASPIFSISGKFNTGEYANKSNSASYFDFEKYLLQGNDTFNGSEYNDYAYFTSSLGKDKMFGNGGNDCIATGSDASTIANGGSGYDWIQSFSPMDTLIGGEDSDIFAIDAFDSTNSQTVITDFDSQTEVLRIKLTETQSDQLASKLYWDNTSEWMYFYTFQIKVGKGLTSAQDFNDYLIYNTSTGSLYLDIDGVGGYSSIKIVTFKNKPQFSITDLALNKVIVSLTGYPDVDDGGFSVWQAIYSPQ